MAYPNVVSDWNGTILSFPTDEQQNKAIAYAVLEDAKTHLRIGKLAKLLRAKKKLERRLQDYKEGRATLAQVYEPFNTYVVHGTPVQVINDAVDAFVSQYIRQLDEGILSSIRRARQSGARTGILSTSYEYGIRRMLKIAGWGDAFNFVVAHRLLDPTERAIRFSDEVYGRKADHMSGIFRVTGTRERNTVYMGDTSEDEPIAEMLPVGHFVVPFFATPEFKEHMATRYRAFVPVLPSELDRYLQGLL